LDFGAFEGLDGEAAPRGRCVSSLSLALSLSPSSPPPPPASDKTVT
jgi:hypothetical protein